MCRRITWGSCEIADADSEGLGQGPESSTFSQAPRWSQCCWPQTAFRVARERVQSWARAKMTSSVTQLTSLLQPLCKYGCDWASKSQFRKAGGSTPFSPLHTSLCWSPISGIKNRLLDSQVETWIPTLFILSLPPRDEVPRKPPSSMSLPGWGIPLSPAADKWSQQPLFNYLQ